MGQPRADGLPNPATVDQLYLAAILEEIRVLRADLSARVPGAPTEGPTLEGAAPVLEALGLPTEPEELREQIVQAVQAEEAAQVAAAEEPESPVAEPAPEPAPVNPKPRAKKPARTRKPK